MQRKGLWCDITAQSDILMATSFSEVDRATIAQRGRYLELFTIAWAVAEGVIALISAERAHSLSLSALASTH
jgi:hypothetical protein